MKVVVLTILICLIIIYTILTIIGIFSKKKSTFINEPKHKNIMEGKRVEFVFDENDKENADGEKGHLQEIGASEYKNSFYDKFVKRFIDKLLAFLRFSNFIAYIFDYNCCNKN